MTNTADRTRLSGLDSLLGVEVVSASGDEVIMSWEVVPDLHQPAGILHGGVHCAVVESAASTGAALWYGDRGTVVGVSNHTDFLRSVREGRLTATATPIHRGGLQQLWVVNINDDGGRLVARGEVRIQNLAKRD